MGVEDGGDEGYCATHSDVFHFVAEAVAERGEVGVWGVDCEAVEGVEEVCLAEMVEVEGDVYGCCGAEGVGDEVAHFAGSKDMDFPIRCVRADA